MQLAQLQAETEAVVKTFEDPESRRQMQSTKGGWKLFTYLEAKSGFSRRI